MCIRDRLKPRDPESKGIVERDNGYFETSFLPGRRFESPDDFNTQFARWQTTVANQRLIRSLKARPVDLLDTDKAAMLPLPPAVLIWGGARRSGWAGTTTSGSTATTTRSTRPRSGGSST